MWAFLVGVLLFIAAVQAQNDYCLIVFNDGSQGAGTVFNVSDLTLSAYLPLVAGDVLGVDISGNDLPNMPIYFNDTEIGPACRTACSQTQGCQYYAYDVCEDNLQGACWLKSTMSAPREHACRAWGTMGQSVPHDIGGGNYTMNLCRATSCGRFTNCQLCQNVGTPRTQYCTGSDTGATYGPLSSPWNANNFGYDMDFPGDGTGCPDQKPRVSEVHVVCNQPQNRLVFVNEPETCKYEYEVYLQGDCSFTPPTPVLSFKSQSKTSIRVNFVSDPHLYNTDYPLTITYTLWLNEQQIYKGPSPSFLVNNLPNTTSYFFTVQGTYNGLTSPVSAPKEIYAVDTILPAEAITQDMVSSLQQDFDLSSQSLKGQIDGISSRIENDVVQVLRHADDSTEDIRAKLYVINNATLVNMQKQLDTLVANQKTGSGSSSGGGVSGGGIAVGMLIGIIVGVIGALFGPKIFQKITGSSGARGEGRY